jgi:pimeloyl-ACP methyl ester carboxylesterase
LFTRDDLTDRLGQITAPTLVIHGTDDAAIPLVHAQKAAQGIHNAKLVVIQGGGHAANMTHAAPVNQAIAEFLATLH